MLTLDHLVIVAPDLAAGVAHVRDGLGVDMPEGGRHREMATRNHLLRLGPATFLEVIAVDATAAPPGRPRWFGLDDGVRVRADWEAGRRLRGWVARTGDLDGLLGRHPGLFGDALAVSRGALRWLVMSITGAICTLGYWSPFFDKERRRGWHDKASNAMAVKT